jgi:ATP-dependent protease Clp ATPase subunit
MEDVQLTFHGDALEARRPSRAIERKTGARGLRSIMETILAGHHVRAAGPWKGVEEVVSICSTCRTRPGAGVLVTLFSSIFRSM